MKRMYVTLAIMFLIVFWAGTLLGQNNSRPVDDQTTDSMEKRMRMREEMHRRMMDKLLNGVGSDDLFNDMEKFMDEVMTDSFNGLNSFSRTTAQNYKLDWSETKTGRTLTITPNSPDQQLDINVSNGLIVIKGKSEIKSSNGISVSNFTNSFNVPGDCDSEKVKLDQKDGKILVQFPYRAVKAVDISPSKNERKPIPPSEQDVQI